MIVWGAGDAAAAAVTVTLAVFAVAAAAAAAAGLVGGIPGGPVDPALVVVARTDIDVFGEWNNGNVDIAGILGERAQLSIRFLDAVCSAGILPSMPIDPVLSRAIATRTAPLPAPLTRVVGAWLLFGGE